ncbi:MAG: septal ring lytic transglycosylase RlpA family protein [Candidatus Peribacteraceae bacterium]|nr:septal ring lytic transglycosylase RlpA family protein [Candidatus Peribacteraceae bacterium]
MRNRLIGIFLCLFFLMPTTSAAQTVPVTRRDGFLLLWNSIRRATLENREPYFTDVSKGSFGEDQITYAKYRGIINDDEEKFRPDEPLMLEDALLWLFRTRSVDDISALVRENLSDLVARYPLPGVEFSHEFEGAPRVVDHSVTEDNLLSLMRTLDDLLLQEDHEVSLYGEKFHGKGTAFGETFDMNALTAAHRTFPYNTLVKVTNIANGKSVTVRINDRGPYVEGRDMDLSVAAFTSIENRSKGKFRATFQRFGDATLVGQCDDTDPRRAVRIAKGVHLIGGIPGTFPLGKDLVFRSTKPFVLRSVRYPDGNVTDLNDWILPDESHPFTPSVEGEYVFTLGSREGRRRELRMMVTQCS